MLAGYDDKDIFNLDETSLFFKLMPNKTLAFRNQNCSNGKLSKERVTLLLGANADGSEKLPALVIGKSKRPRVFKNVKTLPVLYSSNKKAWMIGSEWKKYVEMQDKRFEKEKRKVIFMVDNAPPHLPLDSLSNIKLIYLPPNTTSLTQPMDQGIIKNFKGFYREFLVREIINRLEENNLKATDSHINLLDAVHFIKRAWGRVKSETIKNCFNRCGVSQRITEVELPNDEFILFESLWKDDPVISQLTENVDINDFINLDNQTATCGQLSDDEIINMVVKPLEDSDDSDQEDGQQFDKSQPTTLDVTKAMNTVRNFLSSFSNTNEELSQLHLLQNSIDSLIFNNLQQGKITSYFQKT